MPSTSKKLFSKRHPRVGARPGTLVIEEDAPPPKIRVTQYTADQVNEQEVDDVSTLAGMVDPSKVTWIDIQGFGDEKTLRAIGEAFEMHPLSMEDVVNIPQRPKADLNDNQLLIVSRIVRANEAHKVELRQLTIVLGENFVLTFQELYSKVLEPVRKRIRAGKGPIRHGKADFLAYALLDTLVDGYYPALEVLGEHLEHLEATVLKHPTPTLLRKLIQTKNRLVNLKRIIWAQREAVNSLIRDATDVFSDDVRVYLRDTYDHCVQAAEVTEMYREIVSGLMNTYLSAAANRTNDVMKTLTIMASIFIPLTFLAGIYGMNFEHMPELHYRWAYPTIWVTMIAVVVGMLFFFYNKGWIGHREGGDEEHD